MMRYDTASAAAETPRPSGVAVVEDRLENGLRIVVIPDRRAPILTHMIWYCNGSADDPIGKSGIAHFLEHLMFKGTLQSPPGRFAERLSKIGGEQNAFTSYDYTAYFQRVPREHLEMCMRHEADRMKNLVLDDGVVATERDVVLEERRMRVDASPDAMLSEAQAATLFVSHPYGTPVIGWQHEIESLTRDDALRYYMRFYTPENAILIVAGDVEPTEVVALAGSCYGQVPRFDAAPVRRRPREPRPTTQRRVSLVSGNVGQPIYRRMHVVPSYRSADAGVAEAFDVLATLLGAGQSGLLYRSLVARDEVATGVGAYYVADMVDDSFMVIYAVPAPGCSLEIVESAIEAVLADIVRDGIEDDDLARAKTRLLADAVFAEDSHTDLAIHYGSVLATGASLRDVAERNDRIEAVDSPMLRKATALLDIGTSVSGFLDRPKAV